jgi:hypothetical protein
VARPGGDKVFACLDKLHENAREGVVRLCCLTAPGDHIDRCVILSNSNAPDTQYEDVALCAAQYFKVRATGAGGKPVMDVPFEFPFRFAHKDK